MKVSFIPVMETLENELLNNILAVYPLLVLPKGCGLSTLKPTRIFNSSWSFVVGVFFKSWFLWAFFVVVFFKCLIYIYIE